MKKKIKNRNPFYVIVGNSVAGIAALEAIREIDRERAAMIIDREPRHVYSRPLISYYLEGRVDARRMRLRPAGFYGRMRVEALLGRSVVSVEPGARRLVLDGGARISYGKLLLAVGAEPVVPPIPGVGGPDVFTFTRWDDALSLRRTVGRGTRVVVMGAGLIGIKAAEGLKALGAEVTIVECADRPLPAVLDATAGRIVSSHIGRKGVSLVLSRRVERVERKARGVTAVVLDGGETIPCDRVVCAVGVRPRIGLCNGTGLKVRRGIVVNRRMETSVENIYAAGDVAEASAIGGGRKNIPVWPLAYEQGSAAGANMAGAHRLYRPGTQMNSIEVFGLPVITIGDSCRGGDGAEVIAVRTRRGPGYRKLVLRNDRIVGAIFLEEIERAGIVSGLLRDGVNVGAFKNDLLKEHIGYIYVPREYRARYIAPLEV